MEYFIGVVLGIVIGLLTSGLGMDRDRALYPATLIVIAAYYVLFAVMGGSTESLYAELAAGSIFVALAIAGFRWTLWLTAAGIIGHGIFDVFHGYLIHNAGVPGFWLGFCSSIDIVLGLYLAFILSRCRVPAQPE
ncbi:MAG: hypothetical protein ABIR33_09595 [Pyrinomonadaceae bacterium]